MSRRLRRYLAAGMGGGQYIGPLNSIPDVRAAYSTRRLLTSYTGALLRLRRDSDDAESDFGYKSNGDLNTDAVNSWLGGANGYVHTWYDQSGNGLDAVQNTDANQPAYSATGLNNKPTISFTAASSQYLVAPRALSDDIFSIMMVAQGAPPATERMALTQGDDFGDGEVAFVDQAVLPGYAYHRMGFAAGGWRSVGSTTIAWNSNPTLVYSQSDGAGNNHVRVRGGAAEGTLVTPTWTPANLQLTIGGAGYGVVPGFLFNGLISEIIITTTVLSDDNRESIEDRESAYFGFDLYLFNPNTAVVGANVELVITTYDESGECVHPDVLDFENILGVGQTWNGYRYWMAFTPYPLSDASSEMPSIVASNDGDIWVVPDGLTNPIDTVVPNGNSDPDLWYDSANGRLYCIWRYFSGPNDSLRYRYSTDGVNWSARTEFIAAGAGNTHMSPAIVQVGTTLYIFNYNQVTAQMERLTSTTGIDGPWSAPEATDATGFATNHLDVIYDGVLKKYFAAIPTSVFAISDDGLTWDCGVIVIGGYRHSLVRTATGFDMFTSWTTAGPLWHIGRNTITWTPVRL